MHRYCIQVHRQGNSTTDQRFKNKIRSLLWHGRSLVGVLMMPWLKHRRRWSTAEITATRLNHQRSLTSLSNLNALQKPNRCDKKLQTRQRQFPTMANAEFRVLSAWESLVAKITANTGTYCSNSQRSYESRFITNHWNHNKNSRISTSYRVARYKALWWSNPYLHVHIFWRVR